MKSKDIKSLTPEDITKKLVEVKKELMKLNSQIASGTTPSSPGQVKQLKKTVARLITQLNQKESKKA